MRFVDGTYKQPFTHPWGETTYNESAYAERDVNGTYQLHPVLLYDSNNTYGELDGVYAITGFNNVVENTMTIGGVDYVVIQDVSRNSFADYYALRLN
jgi:hypothetical protein